MPHQQPLQQAKEGTGCETLLQLVRQLAEDVDAIITRTILRHSLVTLVDLDSFLDPQSLEIHSRLTSLISEVDTTPMRLVAVTWIPLQAVLAAVLGALEAQVASEELVGSVALAEVAAAE